MNEIATGRLSEFVALALGFNFRSGVKPDLNGNLRVLQIKHLELDKPIPYEELPIVALKQFKEEQLARCGDVLFIPRAARKIAVPYLDSQRDVIVAAPIYILRITDTRLTPEYLAWYLNQEPAQEYIADQARGTHISLINQTELLHLPVFFPALAKQRQVIRLQDLRRQEKRLVEELEQCREAWFSAQIRQRLFEAGTKKGDSTHGPA